MPAGIFWKQVRSVLLAWYFVITVIVLAAVALITYISYQKVNDDSVVESYRELTYLSAARLRDAMNEFADTLESVARTQDMNSGDVARQQSALDDFHGRLSVFDGGVVVLDNFGRVTATYPRRNEILGQDWSLRGYFRQLVARETVAFSGVLNDGPQAAHVVVVAVPVTGPDGEFNGAMVGMFRLGSQTVSAFYASIVRLRIGESINSYLVDDQGTIIYHTLAGRTGERIREDPAVQAVLSGRNGAQRSTDRNGRFVVSAYAPVPGTPWGLVTEEDWNTLTNPTRRYGQMLLVLLGLGMILPMLGSALLVRQRNREVLERERIQQEMRVASIIQKTLLPNELPDIPGWEVAAHWQPARAVGGDLYDFISMHNGFGLVMADVTDKGMPAALVMASARSTLRGVSERLDDPARILERVNNLLCNDIPRNMFVTCLFANLDPNSGLLTYANAGQNLPYRICKGGGVHRLEATGLPLGLLPGIAYDQFATVVEPGEFILLYSDGVIEAHDSHHNMFGIERLETLLAARGSELDTCQAIIQSVLDELRRFTGTSWEQEDDITLLVLQRIETEKQESGENLA